MAIGFASCRPLILASGAYISPGSLGAGRSKISLCQNLSHTVKDTNEMGVRCGRHKQKKAGVHCLYGGDNRNVALESRLSAG